MNTKHSTNEVLSAENETSHGGYARLADARPILFSAPMVLAILSGRKTQTRRIVKDKFLVNYEPKFSTRNSDLTGVCPYGKPGDILWVRETLYQEGELGLLYDANHEYIEEDLIPEDFNVRLDKNGHYKFCKIPNIYMEKWACRIFLKITKVKVERLRDIFHSDARAEGVDLVEGVSQNLYYNYLTLDYGCNELFSFMTLWQKINGEKSWEENPWVWVIEFERTERPTGFC